MVRSTEKRLKTGGWATSTRSRSVEPTSRPSSLKWQQRRMDGIPLRSPLKATSECPGSAPKGTDGRHPSVTARDEVPSAPIALGRRQSRARTTFRPCSLNSPSKRPIHPHKGYFHPHIHPHSCGTTWLLLGLLWTKKESLKDKKRLAH